MGISKKTKAVLFGLVYGSNLLSAFFLWLCGVCGNIMLGILLIVFYRLSLWSAPFLVSVICQLPSVPRIPFNKKLLYNFFHLILCGMLFLLCYLLFGNWY